MYLVKGIGTCGCLVLCRVGAAVVAWSGGVFCGLSVFLEGKGWGLGWQQLDGVAVLVGRCCVRVGASVGTVNWELCWC